MKSALTFFRSILLTLLFFVFFILFLVSFFVKFDLLRPNFWINSFSENAVYANLSKVLEKSLSDGNENQKIDTAILKNVFEENIYNVLDFVNGTRTKLVFSIPGKTLELQNQIWINYIKGKGYIVTFVLVLSTLFTIILGILLAKYAPGGLVISAIVTLLLISYLIFVYKSSYQTFITGKEPLQLLIAYVAPAIFGQIIKIWAFISFLVLGFGIYTAISYNNK